MQADLFYHVAFVLLSFVNVAAQDGRKQTAEVAPATSRSDFVMRRERHSKSDSDSLKVAPSLRIHERPDQHIKVAHHINRAIIRKRNHRHEKKRSYSSRDSDVGAHKHHRTPPGTIYPEGDRRRRTLNQVWDCDFQANWITAQNIAPTYVRYFNETHSLETVENECKQLCVDMSETCTGLYIYEEENVPGDGNFKCGFFTVDLTSGIKYVKHGTADGEVCFHVGKNFHCSDDANMVQTSGVRDDFSLEHIPSDGVVVNYAMALSWCKRKCISRSVNCQTFWLQEWHSSSWMCGMYVASVADSERIASDNQNITRGCICDTF